MDCQRRRVDNAGATVRCLNGSLPHTEAHANYRGRFGIDAIGKCAYWYILRAFPMSFRLGATKVHIGKNDGTPSPYAYTLQNL